ASLFFFQAEDGIRDFHVTGVQTCALPICGAKRKGNRYFGPYEHAWAIRETVDLMLRVFPVRTCSAGVYRRAQRSGRPCLLGYIRSEERRVGKEWRSRWWPQARTKTRS